MCNCFQNIKLFFKESNQSIRFRVPLPLGCFCVGCSFPSKPSCRPVLGQSPPQSWDGVPVQMARSCQNSQPALPAQVPRQAFGDSLGIRRCSPPSPCRQYHNTCIPFPFHSASNAAPNTSRGWFTLTHTHEPSHGQGLTNWAGADTASRGPIQFITGTDSENENKAMVPAPWVLVPHTKKDGTQTEGARHCTQVVGTLLQLSGFTLCSSSVKRPGQKALYL